MRMAARKITKILPASVLWFAATAAAHAHPNIFIDAHANITMGENGQITGITHIWTFDPLFSSWLVQGIERDENGKPDQHRLDEIALHDVTELFHYGYYTQVTGDGAELDLRAIGSIEIEEVDGRLKLAFEIAPPDIGPPHRETIVSIFDPHYYTAFSFSDPDGITIIGVPDQCTAARQQAETLPDSIQRRLADLPAHIYELPPELAAAIGGREGRITISCEAVARAEHPFRPSAQENGRSLWPF